MLWAQTRLCKFEAFFQMLWIRQKPWFKSRSLFDNVVTHQKCWCKFGSFFHNVVNASKTVLQNWVLFHSVVNLWKMVNTSEAVMQVSLFSQCCEHIKNSHASFDLFFTILLRGRRDRKKKLSNGRFSHNFCGDFILSYFTVGYFEPISVHASAHSPTMR